jgi:hypothetical protein
VGGVERIESWSLLRPGTNVTFVRLCYSNTIAVIGSEVIQLNKKVYCFLRSSQWESPRCSILSLHVNLALAFATA